MRQRDDGAWWGVNGVRWQTAVGNWGVDYGGKRLNRSGDQDGLAVVMETSRPGNSLFLFFLLPDRQSGRQAHGGWLLSVWILRGFVGTRWQRPRPHTHTHTENTHTHKIICFTVYRGMEQEGYNVVHRQEMKRMVWIFFINCKSRFTGDHGRKRDAGWHTVL